MFLLINGYDMTKLIDSGGFNWQRNDLDGKNAGRTLDGLMHRDRVAIKAKINVALKPLTGAELQKVLAAIKPQYVTVTYDDPQDGRRTTTFYSNNAAAECDVVYKDGTELWRGVKFPLIER